MNNWFYGTGKRKCAIARVFMQKGKNNIIVNNKNLNDYFSNNFPYKLILEPLICTKTFDKFFIKVKVKGGGDMAQIIAIRLGIARALLKFNKNLKIILKKKKFLTRDSRIVERKKLGRHKARKQKQFSKR